MIKVAIAGTNGLAQLIAHYISTTTSHQFVFLSRRPSAGLTAKGWQVLQVDYSRSSDLRFKLAGVDTIISTICGDAQLALIDAAAAVRVRRFIPSEFGGAPSVRPQNDLLDDGRRDAIHKLAQYESSGMRFAVFTCGVFYERFSPGGLAASQLGLNTGFAEPGSYILNMRQREARLPYTDSSGHSAYVCMTSIRDVAQAVVLFLNVSSWPREIRIRGDRMSVREIVAVAEQATGRTFDISRYSRKSLTDALTYARAVRDRKKESQLHQLVTTAEGRFDFTDTNANQFISIRPEKFRDFLHRVWS